jgi:hypothetical protein
MAGKKTKEPISPQAWNQQGSEKPPRASVAARAVAAGQTAVLGTGAMPGRMILNQFAPSILELFVSAPEPLKTPAQAKHYLACPRRVPKEFAREVKRHGTGVGEILWAWNRIHGWLSSAFWILLGNHDTGLALWQNMRADSVQRESLRVVLYQNKKVHPYTADALEWLLNVMDELAKHRNDAAHAPMLQEKTPSGTIYLVPDSYANPPARVARLMRRDQTAFHRKLKGDLVSLSFFAGHILLDLPLVEGQKPQSLRKRPSLQSIRLSDVHATRAQTLRREAAHKRRPRRRSSRK